MNKLFKGVIRGLEMVIAMGLVFFNAKVSAEAYVIKKTDGIGAYALAIREIIDEKPAMADTVEELTNYIVHKEQNKDFVIWILIVLGLSLLAGVFSIILDKYCKK